MFTFRIFVKINLLNKPFNYFSMKKKMYFLLLLAFVGFYTNTNAQNITTIAGNGSDGVGGDGGPATSAPLAGPISIARDGNGNSYIADIYRDRVRKVTSAGIITTVAGIGNTNGNSGPLGDGGLATLANLGAPTGVAVDALGNIYICASGRVRKVTISTGIITTVAGGGSSGLGDGGLATAAPLIYPQGIALDASGNIYICASGRVRKVTISTGIITTVAGGGSSLNYSGEGGLATNASIPDAFCLAVDASNNIYIGFARAVGLGASTNARICKITASTGIINTIVGTGVSGFSGDGGLATSATISGNCWGIFVDASNDVYFSDTFNGRVRKVIASTGIITTIIDGGIINPAGIHVVNTDSLYLAEFGTGFGGGFLRFITLCPATITPTNLLDAVIGIPYSQIMTQIGLTGAVTWSVSAGSLPNGLFISQNSLEGVPTIEGTYNFSISVTNIGNCKKTKAYSLIVGKNPFTTAIDNSLSNLVKVSPNPSKADFNVDFGSLNLGKTLVRVYDAQGKTVFSSETEINNNTMKIILANFANGLYLLEINSTKGNVQKRIIKAD